MSKTAYEEILRLEYDIEHIVPPCAVVCANFNNIKKQENSQPF